MASKCCDHIITLREICQLYSTNAKAGVTTDDVRYWLFCQKMKKNESLPPTTDSLLQHVRRASYQAFIWMEALIAKPNLHVPPTSEHGWKIKGGALHPELMTKDPAPKALLELTYVTARSQHAAELIVLSH